MIKRLKNIFDAVIGRNGEDSHIAWKLKKNMQKEFPGFASLNARINCDLLDACFNGTHVWISHKLKTLYFETPKAASSTMRHILGTNNPALWFYKPEMRETMRKIHAYPFQTGDGYFEDIGKVRTACMNIFADVMGVSDKSPHQYRRDQAMEIAIREMQALLAADGHNSALSYRERVMPSVYGFQMYYGTPLQAADEFDSYFKFSVVRNPYEKMVSNYSMFCRRGKMRKDQIALLFDRAAETVDFKTFISLSRDVHNHHWEQYLNYVPVRNGAVVLDETLRVETLNDQWGRVKRSTGIRDDIQHLNKTRHRSYRDYYDPESKQHVEKAFRADIELFDYDF